MRFRSKRFGSFSSDPPPRIKLFALLLMAGSSVVPWSPARAQDEAKAPQKEPDHPYTLHVYANLIQIPSLVLTPAQGSYRGLKSTDFTLRLDSGPAFHPFHARLEGNDPVSFAFLLDDGATSNTILLEKLDKAVAKLSPEVFRPQDRLEVFALDCNLVRSVDDVASLATLRTGIGKAMQDPALHGDAANGGKCHKHLPLWDAIGAVANQVHDKPGRRVMVAITDGIDDGSQNRWDRVRQYASDYSIAIFALQPAFQIVPMGTSGSRHTPGADKASAGMLEMLCEGTGGLLLDANPANSASQLRRIMELLRNRYILEFPRASGSEAGLHRIDVSVADRNAIIHTSGIAVPVEDKSLLDDPNTVPSDTSHLPVMGTGEQTKSHNSHTD